MRPQTPYLYSWMNHWWMGFWSAMAYACVILFAATISTATDVSQIATTVRCPGWALLLGPSGLNRCGRAALLLTFIGPLMHRTSLPSCRPCSLASFLCCWPAWA
jgi:hypothetical protein